MTAPLRAVVVGCGAVAGNHAAAYRDLPGVELAGCADVDPARAAAFAAAHGNEVVDPLEADLVSVCTPQQAHEEVVVAAAARGVHVLCEKPVAADLAAAGRMVAACEAADVRFGVLFQRRFWPAAQRVRRAIDDGTLGTPVLGHASVLLHRDPDYYAGWRAAGAGVLDTQAIHNIDLLQWYLGEAVEVTAHEATLRHPVSCEDTAVAVLRFASGALATLAASTVLTPGLGTRVLVTGATGASAGIAEYPEGTEGRLDVWAVPGAAQAVSPFGSGLGPDRALGEVNGALAPFHRLQIAEFVDAVRERRDPAVTGREAARSLAILTALHASAASGTPERVPALFEEIPA